MIVEVSTHGSIVKRNHDQLIIKNSEEKTEIPAEKVDAIIISSNSLISTGAIRLCLEKEIQMIISEWSGRPIARLWASTPGKSTEIRRLQYTNLDTQLGLKICKEIVILKLKRQKKLLLNLKNNRKKIIPQLDSAITTFEKSLQKVSTVSVSPNLKSNLLGIEGSCAVQYFKAVSLCLPKRWMFETRSQNPAHDEFNTVLNYIYGMGYSSVEKIIILSGLDPNAGFYHADTYGKPTLSFDIIELLRAEMDRIVISLFTKRKVKENWFQIQDDNKNLGIFLTKEGRHNLISAYYKNSRHKIEKESWNFCRKIIEKLHGAYS